MKESETVGKKKKKTLQIVAYLRVFFLRLRKKKIVINYKSYKSFNSI